MFSAISVEKKGVEERNDKRHPEYGEKSADSEIIWKNAVYQNRNYGNVY